MLDYKSPPESDSFLDDRAPSSNIDGTVSLTWLWEVIIRTKRLPDDLDPKVLFLVLKDRLRNPEREVRQNALRVLADLIPVVEQHVLDNHMKVLLQDLIVNLSYVAPAVRKGAIDVVRVHIKHSPHPNEVLKKLLTAVPQDSHLVLGLMMAVPYFANINYINEDTALFVLRQLVDGTHQEFLKEASLGSLIKLRGKWGKDRFNSLMTPETVKDFEDMCKEQNLLLESPKSRIVNDNVILETEITLETGPAITMQIHEETSKPLSNGFSDSDDDSSFRHKPRVVRMLTDESDSEVVNRSPRKVRFGGEVVKMRTPESDSNQPSDDNDTQTSLVIDRPTSIKITVSDNVANIKTRHRSQIPVRITTGGSNPPTPRKKVRGKKRMHKSAPELDRIHISKIPLRSSQVSEKNEHKTKLRGTLQNNLMTEKGGSKIRSSSPAQTEINLIVGDQASSLPVINEHHQRKSIELTSGSLATEDHKNWEKRSLVLNRNDHNLPENFETKYQVNMERRSSYLNNANSIVVAPDNFMTESKENRERRSSAANMNSIALTPGNFKGENQGVKERKSSALNKSQQTNLSDLSSSNLMAETLTSRAKSPSFTPTNQANSNGLSPTSLGAETKVKQRRRSVSPIPVHNAVEMLHNLSRSPVPQQEEPLEKVLKTEEFVPQKEEGQVFQKPTYDSFKVYSEEIQEKEDDAKSETSSILQSVIQDLVEKDDIWSRSRNLDDLIAILQEAPSSLDSLHHIQPLFQALFTSEKHYRLQNRAQEALRLVVSAIDSQKLQEVIGPVADGVVKIGPPNGVRLALFVMQKTSPRMFFDNLKVTEPKEKILQALIAATRTFPSSEINVVKGVHLAFGAMKDPKRAVKQAALETLASLAQVVGNPAILSAISEVTRGQGDYEDFLRVIRTRLSRKQLPTVDLNGNIRYSSPREQEEFDWLCGGSVSIRKTMSLNSIKIPANNYWKHNSRHDLDFTSLSQSLEGSSNDESLSKEQIWAIDAARFPKLDNVGGEKATLCPVYVLHRDSPQLNNGRNYRNYDRGRSNSPPKSRGKQVEEGINGSKARRFFRQKERFQKSFSSEHIYSNGNVKQQEPTSFSLSSRSSTTSTGSSTKSGIWLKDFRSGIPVPIAGTETKLKMRYTRHHQDAYTGPMIVQDCSIRKSHVAPAIMSKRSSSVLPIKIIDENMQTKLMESPQNSPIVISRGSPQQLNQQEPPRSSGSESSGYFTPPPDHHLKDQVDRFISEETLEENNNASVQEPDFQVMDSEASESHETVFMRQSSASSVEAASEDPEAVENPKDEPDRVEQHSPLDGFDFDENPRAFIDPRSKSKSEVNLETLPDIERKNVNSAPPLKDVDIVPYQCDETPQPSPVKTCLPGSVSSNEESPVKKPESTTPRRLVRRCSRASSLKRQPKTAEVPRPYSRPKEALLQALTQMENPEWETTMQGLNGIVTLARNHPEIVESQMHSVCLVLAKNIKNLRSQVARTACHAASEIFASCQKGSDMEMEELAGPLLHRTADTNKFLRSDANSALDVMSLNLSLPRVVTIIATKGATHNHSVVRAAATRLLSDIAGRIGCEKVYHLPKDIRDRFLLVGANGLTEGSLETRKHAKSLMAVLAKHNHFQKALADAVPQHTRRHIAKALGALM